MSTGLTGGGLPPPPPPAAAFDTPGAPDHAPPAPAPATRGITRVTDRAARRIAVAAAGEVDGVLGVPVTGLAALIPDSRNRDNRGDDTDRGRRVEARAAVDDNEVTVDITVGLEYPRPVSATLQELASHLARRLSEYGGLQLARLDITVAELGRPSAPRPRRVV